jgi:hypothetical protein
MLKMSVWLWIVLTIVVISLPVGLLSFFFSKTIFKKLRLMLSKIDTFDSLVRFKKKLVYLYKTKILRVHTRERHKYIPEHVQQDDESESTKSTVSTASSIDDIVKIHSSVSKHPESGMVDEEDDKITIIKRKKMIEKIIYDAL